MDCVFVKARKISKSLKGNRGSAINYSKYLDRTLKGVDYQDKGKLLASGINGTEESSLAFWTKAEKRELQTKRKDTARFAKEYIVGLPHNLPIEEMKKISETISKELSKNGRVVSWYLHEPDQEEGSDERNYHSHFLLSEREYDFKKKIFSETKNRDWNTKTILQNHKKMVGEKINERLFVHGLPPIKIELAEDEKIGINKTENQIKAEKANLKMLKKTEKKIKYAEVKLNGLRGLQNRPTNRIGIGETEPGTKQPNNTGTTSKTSNIFEEYKQYRANQRDKKLRVPDAGRIAEEQQRKLKKNRYRLQQTDKDDFSIGR